MGLNRIYKVVWNKTKGCYVVVSELAKRVGRNKAKAIVISSAAMAMAVSPVVTSTVGAALNQAGTGSDNAVALGEAANANQARAVAIGKGATISSGQDTIAIGTDTKVEGHTSIVIGKNAKTTNNAEGTVVIGRDAFSEGSGKADRPNTVVGRGAYTAFGANGSYRMNASTALGFQAGSGIRVDSKANNKLVDNNTNADSNENVLVKAGYGLQDIKDAAQKVEMDKTKAFLQAGFAHNGLDKTGDSGKSTDIANGLSFYRKSDINEATAIGAEARAIGDQSIAIGGQVVAGDGVVALGGNDTDQLRNNKYQVVTDDAVNRTNVNTIDDYNLAYTESTTTVAGQFKKLVNRDMPTGYRSTYGQSGSVVIGMEAHSTTALGTAIGTNSVVRMGAFGATAIGAGSTVQANAEAAVAVGMGSVANGAYALAGGTASWAEYGDIALGYQAKASGKDGAIAMGRATNAQGDSSIMIGGANIASAAAQSTSFEKSNGAVTKKTVIEKINGKNVNREYTFAGTTSTNGTVAEAYKELTGLTMETAALDFAKNKNGHASTSLGVHALSKGDLSTAIGAGSRSEAIGSVALGVGAHATRQNAVAIGTGSTTDLVGTRQLSVSYDKDGNVVDDNSPNKAYTFNWAGGTNTAEGDVVSFGSSGSERQLKNVAAGRVAEDSTDAINGSQLNAISKKLATGWNIAGDPKTKVAGIGTDDQVNFVNGNGTTVTVTKQEEVKNGNTVTTPKGANVKFDIKAADGSITSNTSGISVNTDGDTIGKTADGKLKANTGTINTGNDGKAAPNTGDGNKLATVDTVVNAVNNAAWKATAGSVDSGTETGKSEEKIKAGDVVTFKAGNNLAIKQDGKNFIYSLKPELTGLTSAGFKNAAGDTTVIDGNGMTITPKDAPAKPVSLTKEGLDNGGKTIKNVTSGLTNYGPGTPKEGLVDLKTTAGTPAVPDTTAATVGDLRNMGWVVSSDKTTGELTKAYTDQVKNADEVKFVGEGGVTVSGKTENGIRTITVKAEAQEMPEQPVSYTTADGTKVYPKTVTKEDGTKEVKYYSEPNGKGNEIPKENVVASINGPEGTKAPTTLSNVAGNLDGAKKGTQVPTTEHAPVNTTNAAAPNYVNPNNAATVGDVLNAGWNLQNNGTAKDFVKPYDTVNFVNGANTTAVVTTNTDGTTSNVTYNITGLPVTYTDAEGNPVAKVGDKYYKVNNQGQPVDADGNPSTKVNDKGQPLDAQGNVIDPVDTTKPLKTALVNPTPAADKTSTTSPTSLNNVKNNIPTVNDADKKAYDVNGAPIDGKNNTAAPITAKEAADLLNPTKDGKPNPNFVGNNAATVSDVLNAGWNLQNNGEARDFVKPYDTVNFVNGANTTAVVTTAADGTISDVTYNVTGLPVTFTDKDGKPVSKIGDKYYPVNEKGQPITPDGKPAVKTNEEGKPVAEDGTVIEPIDTKANPLQSNLVNPNVANTTEKTNNQTTSPTQLGNVANGANTFEPVDGKKMANDGKWYPADQVEPNGQPKENVQPVAKPDNVGKAGLIDFSKSNPNNAATVGDLQNLGWIVSAEGNNYSDQVRNANEVKFVGEGTATVTGKTDDKGVRTITVKVDDQASTNNAQTPVVYTDKDGKKVYPIKGDDGTVTYHTTPDGKGDNDEVVPNNNVVTSINGPEGTTSPTELKNVKNNIPAVNDADKKVTNPDGTEKGTAGDVNNINKAPLTAADAADLLNPTKDGKPNPKFAGNNAATVSDVLNAGWNLQNNGEARDFVKPYDTVNFVNGANTTAVVTTSEDGTTSNVTYNVTGLPVTFTDKDGKQVSKIGDKYYPVNEKGQPVTPDGKPAVKTNEEGKPVTADGTVIEPIDTKANPLQSNLVNPNVENTKEKPNNQTTSPTQLGNVANGAKTFDPVEDKKLGNDGKWYNAADVLPNGQPKENVQPVAKPENVGKAGLIDFSKSNPNNAATVGDLQNLGWIVSAEGNNYSDQVRNANEVKFVGEGTATVTGKTDENGVRTITVKVDDQVSTNNAQTPVVYTDKDGKKVYPIKGDDGTVTYHTTPDGKGDNDQVVPNNNVVTSINGPEGTTSPTELKNVKNNIPAVNDADKKVTNPDGTEKGTAGDVNNINKAPLTATEAADLLNPTKDGKPNPNFVGNNAATVSDVLNAGWNLQNNGTAKDFVKPYDTVNFVDGANTTAVVTTNEDGTTSNVTYNVTGLPVTFTDKDGKPVSKIGDKYYPVNEKGQPVTPDGKPAVKTNAEGKPVTEDGTVIEPIDTAKDPLKSNMVNPNVANTADAPNNQTTTPTQLGNVKSNLPTVNDADKKASDVDGNPIDGKNNTAAPITAADAADLLNPTKDGKPNPKFAGNNAATVSDVLNAGWNLQNNGEARDFVKPYDTVNFVDGANTTAVVTTNEDGTTSNVTYNVTGLPVTFTDKDGKPVSKIGDKYYPVNEKGQPVTPDGKPAVTTNAEGKPVTEDGTVIEPINTDENPLQTNLVNPNVANSKEAPNNQTTSPTQLGNVANGANTFAPVDGKKMANDGKWYPADQVEPNGQPKTGAAPVDVPANIGKAGLIDFSKSNPNNAATVGDLQNLGWIVSAEGNNYSDQVRNANEVKFVGEGTASVTGKTDENGVRTITVKVDDQVSTNNAQTPVNYTNKDGKKVYPVKDENGNVTYHTTPDGKGAGDETVPAGDVITSLNGPEGTTAPTTLNNVKNNIPAVNDADKKVTNPDGTEKGTAGDVNNINKAPLTATEAADLLKPTKDGKPNPNFAGNNAATVSDVLNAGWNLQNNGEARDFVKPFDTVNFVNGGNTTAVVTTAADGTTSDVTFNVTGLPITYTTADGKPVSKVGDKYYPVNEKGQPIGPNGKPAVKTAPNGDLLDEAGNVIQPIDTAKDPLKSNMVNPNVANTADAPNNQTTTPTQLGNIANGAETFKPADDVKLANDGKWYPADQVEPNGKPKKDATPVASPLVAKNAAGDVLEKGNDGNWYKSSDLEKGEPKPNAKQQSPEPKPKNADKAGLINFENSNPNNAATVGDLQNMGFVVSAKDNGYTEQMRNANKVEFKGDNGVQVTGKTLADGTREITVALKEGRVTNDVLITDKDGKVTHGVRGEDGKIYTKDPKTGKATNEEIPVTPSDTVENDGNAYVTGNSVATAIQKSGWNIGIGSTDKAFSEEAKTYERVNPKDNVKYVNGANTTVSMAVDAAEDKDGATVTTTYVKVDVNRDLHIDRVTTGGPAKDKAGNLLKQVNDEYYPENALVNDGKVYPAGTVMIDGKPYPAGSAKDPKTKTVLKDGKPAPEAQPLTATPKDQLADGKDGAMTVKDAKGNDGVSATAKDGKGTLTLKDGKDASQVDISTAKAPADLENTPKDAVRANDGNWYAPADVTVEVKDGKTVVTPKAGKTPIPNAPTMDRIQYTDGKGTSYNVATMNDGLRFVGDDGETISKPLNSTMEFTGGNREDTGKPVAKADTTTGNIGVFHDKGKLSIQLAKDLEKLNSANFESKTDKAGNPLKVVDGKYYPEKAVVKEGKVYPEGTVIIDNKPYPAGTTKDAAGNVVHNGKPATEATPINPIDSKQVQDGPTSRLTGTGLTFNTPTPKDEKGNPLVLVDGKYYKADNLENGKPKADAKAEPVKPAQSTAFTPDGLVVTPETAKVRDANGNPVLDKDGREVVDPTKVVSFGSPTIAVDPKTGKPMVDPKTGEPVMKSGISAGGQVMANVAPGVLDTDAVNVSQLKGVSNMVMNVNNRVNRLGAQAAAMAGLRHLQYDPLEPTTIMAGVGAYKGEAALALGIAHYKNESTLFHAGASIGSRGDELMANAGVSWKFGARADETAVKDTFRQGPISSSYTLQDKVSALEAQNQVQKDEINNLKAQLAEVLQYVKKG